MEVPRPLAADPKKRGPRGSAADCRSCNSWNQPTKSSTALKHQGKEFS